jgi:hypothetical protein
MKYLSLLVWVTQFGFSVLFPVCFFLMVAFWLQQKFALGIWIVAVLGVLGVLIAIGTAKANWRAMRKDAEAASDNPLPPIAFNDHL